MLNPNWVSLFLTLSNQPPPINQTSKSKSTLWLQWFTHKYPEGKDKKFEKMKENPSIGTSILQHYLQQIFACFFLLAFLLLHHHLSFKNWALVIVMVIMRNRQTDREDWPLDCEYWNQLHLLPARLRSFFNWNAVFGR